MVTITFPGTEILGTQIPTHILGTDPVPKAYVDGKVGQYAGGFLLFLNFSQDSDIPFHRVLGTQVTNAAQGDGIVSIEVFGINQSVKNFVSEPLGVEVIPTGLFNAYIYGRTINPSSLNQYHFELLVRSEDDTEVTLALSNYSRVIDYNGDYAAVPFMCSATIGLEYATQVTDRLVLRLKVSNFGGVNTYISTYFEGQTYSFIQTSLNVGTTLLSSNNTWTGTNLFPIPFTSNLNFESSGLTAVLNGAELTMTGVSTDSLITNDSVVLTSSLFQSTFTANTMNVKDPESVISFLDISATLDESVVQVQDMQANLVQITANSTNGASIGITDGVSGNNLQLTSSKLIITGNSGLLNEVLKSDGAGNVVWGTTFIDVYEGKCPVNDWLSVHLANTLLPSYYGNIGYTKYDTFGWIQVATNDAYVMVHQILAQHGVWAVNFSASISNPDEMVSVVVRSVEICVSVQATNPPDMNPAVTYMKQSLILPDENLTNTFQKNLTTSGILSLDGPKLVNFFVKVYKSTNPTALIKLGYTDSNLNTISITRLA